jgi:hypothetical protein
MDRCSKCRRLSVTPVNVNAGSTGIFHRERPKPWVFRSAKCRHFERDTKDNAELIRGFFVAKIPRRG